MSFTEQPPTAWFPDGPWEETSRENVWLSETAKSTYDVLLGLRSRASSAASDAVLAQAGTITRSEQERLKTERSIAIEKATSEIDRVIALLRREYLTVRITYRMEKPSL